MKKTKLIFSTFVLALTLVCTSIATTNTYADTGDPQGTSNSTKAPPPPPPPPPPSNPVVDIVEWLLSLVSA